MKTMRQSMVEFVSMINRDFGRSAKINDLWRFYWRGTSFEFFSTAQKSMAKKNMKESIGSDK